jgi:imidazolonepropionase-like amidohydrolase
MKGIRIVAMLIGVGVTAAEARAECVIVSGVTAYLPNAVKVEDVDIVVDGEAIAEVGKSGVRVAREGCRRLSPKGDGQAAVVTAGFIAPWTELGLVEISAEEATVDTDLRALHQDEEHAVRAAVKASRVYDPRSTPIPVARNGGVTSALVVPTGGIIAGQAFWVDLAGERRGETIARDPAAIVAYLGPGAGSRATSFHVVEVALKEAKLWEKQREAWLKAERAPFANMPLDLEALVPVVKGEIPLVVTMDRAADIESFLEMTEGLLPKVVFYGASEGWMVADLLAKRKAAVIIDPLLYGPGGFDDLYARRDNAALLARAGVGVMMVSSEAHNVRKLRQVAGNAVREGMSWKDALLALTETPARVFGLERYGRIEARAIGNIVIWSGDPFEVSTRALHLFIRGREVPMKSRQTELFERWRKLD